MITAKNCLEAEVINTQRDLIKAQEYIKELASEHTVLLVKHRDLEQQLEALQAQRSMQEEIIKSAYARCRDLEQQLIELQAKRKPLTDDEIIQIAFKVAIEAGACHITVEDIKDPSFGVMQLARAIESAHGITDANDPN